METLGWLALALATASVLRSVLALPALLAWLRGGRVRSFVAGETPPISIRTAGPPDAFLHQNYPEYEVLAESIADSDVVVRVNGEPRHGIVVLANPQLRPDPLFLRDVAAGGQVSFVPVVCDASVPASRAVQPEPSTSRGGSRDARFRFAKVDCIGVIFVRRWQRCSRARHCCCCYAFRRDLARSPCWC
ncbi:MAG: hypothetical protein ACYS0E_06585 [Planctomycetota bacterium]|jgi:hypothetical protein